MNIDGTFLRVNGKLENTLILRTDSDICYVAAGCKGQKAVDQTSADRITETSSVMGKPPSTVWAVITSIA